MAAASYTSDLTTYNDCTSTTGWAEATNMEAADGSGIVDTDLAIYGVVCYTESQRKAGLSSLVFTGTAPTWTSGWAYFAWHKMFAPNALSVEASGGIRMLIGSTSANYYGYYLGGSDTYNYGGWVNFAVDPEVTPRDQTQGTPTGTWNTVGIGWNLPTNGISKGNSLNIDILRYGRGESRFTDGDLANGYATFTGYAAINDNPTTGRLGLIQEIAGGYLFKGSMQLGTATAVDFRDSNTSISIDNTTKVQNDFNKIEINNASSYVEMSSIAFTSLGTVSPCTLEMVDNASVLFDSCNFTLMSAFTFDSNFTGNTSTWTQCGRVSQGDSQLDGCVFNESVATTALFASDIDIVTNCTFISDGTGHAIELSTAHAGNSYTLDGCEFEEYALTNGTTGNESLYNNSGGAVSISVINGTTPTVRNGTSASTTFVTSVILTMTVKDTNGNPVENAYAYIDDDNAPTYIMNELTTAAGIATETWTGGAVVGATWRVRKYGYKPFKLINDVPATGSKEIPVTLVTDLQQT